MKIITLGHDYLNDLVSQKIINLKKYNDDDCFYYYEITLNDQSILEDDYFKSILLSIGRKVISNKKIKLSKIEVLNIPLSGVEMPIVSKKVQLLVLKNLLVQEEDEIIVKYLKKQIKILEN